MFSVHSGLFMNVVTAYDDVQDFCNCLKRCSGKLRYLFTVFMNVNTVFINVVTIEFGVHK